MQAAATVDVEEDAAGEELEDGGVDEELDHGVWGEADVKLQGQYGEAP